MSLDATRWAWMQTCRRATDKLVLLSMADRADENHVCFPSVTRLSADTQLNRKTVMEAIRRLQKVGLIDTVKSTGASNVYRLVGVPDRAGTYPKNGTSTKTGTSPKNGTTPVPKTVHDQSQKRDTNLSITSQEPTKRKKRTDESVTLSAWLDSLPDGQLAIQEGGKALRYVEDQGIPIEWAWLAWKEFEKYYTEEGAKKRYADWEGHFLNALRKNWYHIWYKRADEWLLTTRGEQLRHEMRREAA